MVLPVVAGIIGAAVSSASDIALGIGSVLAVGAGIKGAVDLKEASDYRDAARYKYSVSMEELNKEKEKTQTVLRNFARLKVKTYRGILKDALIFLVSSPNADPERVKAFAAFYKAGLNRFTGKEAYSSIEVNDDGFSCDDDGSFDADDILKIALGGPVGFLLTGSEKLTDAVRKNAEADVHASLNESDKAVLKSVRKAAEEGKKLTEAFTSRIRSLISLGPSASEAVLAMAESLFQIISVDLVDREGKLIESSARLYKTKMREVKNG